MNDVQDGRGRTRTIFTFQVVGVLGQIDTLGPRHQTLVGPHQGITVRSFALFSPFSNHLKHAPIRPIARQQVDTKRRNNQLNGPSAAHFFSAHKSTTQTKQSHNQRGGVKAHLPVVFHHPQERDSVHYGTLVRLFRDAQVLFQLALGQVVQHTRVHQTRGETVGVLFLESRRKTFW